MFRILIADDDPLMREALSIMIKRVEGFQHVCCVGSGTEAVELCKSNQYDIVFMDIIMPGMSGIEAAKEIYRLQNNITIYIISSYSNFGVMKKLLRMEIKEYIVKPISFSAVSGLLENYKDSHLNLDYKQLEVINGYLKTNNYVCMYYEIPEIISRIYAQTGDDEEKLITTFSYIGQCLLNSQKEYHHEKRKIVQLFPVNKALIKEKRIGEIWLNKLMTYIFRQKSIHRYAVLENVFLYIDSQIKHNIGLNDITGNCSISQGYLSRIFRDQFGISVMEYLHMQRMNIAKVYFAFTDLMVSEVAFQLGYNESSYFSKLFKKFVKVTIQEYKQSINRDLIDTKIAASEAATII